MLKVFLIVFGLQFLLELPDKTMIAMIFMGTKARPLMVFAGGAVAFTLHMAIAVGAGSLLTLLPHTLKESIIAMLFLGGAAYLLFVSEEEEEAEGEREAQPEHRGRALREAATAFTVIFVGEFGDLTQIQAASLQARYKDWPIVFTASSLALITIAFIGAFGGKQLARIVPLSVIRKLGGLVFGGLGLYTLINIFVK